MWNIDEVIGFEQQAPFEGNLPDFKGSLHRITNVVPHNGGDDEEGHAIHSSAIPISVMALQSALSVVTYSLTQNLIIQDIDLISFDFSSSTLPTILDNFEQSNVQEDTSQPTSSFVKCPTPTSIQTPTTSTPYVMTALDVGKVLVSGGTLLNAKYINKYRKLGAHTRIKIIQDSFGILENNGFGTRFTKFEFLIYNNIEEVIAQSDAMRYSLINMGVSLSMLREAIQKPNNEVQPPASKKVCTDISARVLPHGNTVPIPPIHKTDHLAEIVDTL